MAARLNGSATDSARTTRLGHARPSRVAASQVVQPEGRQAEQRKVQCFVHAGCGEKLPRQQIEISHLGDDYDGRQLRPEQPTPGDWAAVAGRQQPIGGCAKGCPQYRASRPHQTDSGGRGRRG
jgi:hypothetical protein